MSPYVEEGWSDPVRIGGAGLLSVPRRFNVMRRFRGQPVGIRSKTPRTRRVPIGVLGLRSKIEEFTPGEVLKRETQALRMGKARTPMIESSIRSGVIGQKVRPRVFFQQGSARRLSLRSTGRSFIASYRGI